jgi:hypothetical protein
VPIRYVNSGLELTDQLIKQARRATRARSRTRCRSHEAARQGLPQEDQPPDLRRRHRHAGDAGDLAGGGDDVHGRLDAVPEVGQIIDVRTKTTGALENAGNVSLTITAINRTTKVVTVSANVTATTTTAGVYIAGSYGLESRACAASARRTARCTGSTRRRPATSSGTRRSAPRRRGRRRVALRAARRRRRREGDGEIDVFLTTRGIRRRLADTYQSQKRLNDAKAVEIHGGYTAIYVNEIPVVADDDVPKGWAFGLPNDAFTLYEVEAADWLESRDGTVWHLANGSVAGTRAPRGRPGGSGT